MGKPDGSYEMHVQIENLRLNIQFIHLWVDHLKEIELAYQWRV